MASVDLTLFSFASNGNVLPGVHITVYRDNGDFLVEADTGLDGYWHGGDTRTVNPGKYRAVCTKSGYITAEVFLVNYGAPPIPWDIKLQGSVTLLPIPAGPGGD